jgi:phage terminase large subunit-like protein
VNNAWALLRLPPQQMIAAIENFGAVQMAQTRQWPFWQREDQQMPAGPWRIWLILAGRGYGKTRMGAEWARAKAMSEAGVRIALVGATIAEARAVMVEGESGMIAICRDDPPEWKPSLNQLHWRNGSMATLYSAAEPETLRGPQHHYCWADEIAKWGRGMAVWDNLTLGLRLGAAPQLVATTTPRPVPLIKRLIGQEGVQVSYGRTADNNAALAPSFMESVQRLYAGTRLGRQELDGVLIEDFEGALWSRDLIEKARVACAPEMKRIVIGVDPPATSGGDACGIIVLGKGRDDKAYLLADCSVSGRSPEGWARAVAAAAQAWNADRVVAEGNMGGEMVESTLRAADMAMPIKRVHARLGKSARAEPVAALYESGRAFHAGAFPQVEDELCGLIAGGGYEGPGRSPDRADALVWAMTELMLGKAGVVPRVRIL